MGVRTFNILISSHIGHGKIFLGVCTWKVGITLSLPDWSIHIACLWSVASGAVCILFIARKPAIRKSVQ